MKCSDSSTVTGSFTVENVKIRNGQFHVKDVQGPSESNNVTVVFSGRLSNGAFRGSASVTIRYLGGGTKAKCWTGKAFNNPNLPYVAKLK
jgi:hypothetical protein